MPANQLNQFLNGKAGLITGYAIALALLAYAVLDVYTRSQDIREMKTSISAANQAAGTNKPARKTSKDTRQVASLYVFGKAKNKAKSTLPVEKAPVTRLKLTLIGIIAADEGGISRAIIRIDNKQTAIFSVGDALPTGNAEVYEIQPGQILLMRNGKLESLAIERPELTLNESAG